MEAGGYQLSGEGISICWAPDFFSKQQADGLLEALLSANEFNWRSADLRNVDPTRIAWRTIAWRHETIRMFGREVMQPRFTAWHGDAGKSYTYSGRTMHPDPWNEVLLRIKNPVEDLAGTRFNSVLLNWYRDGQDSMGWHSDDEPELGPRPIIGSVNLGAARRFLLRRKEDHRQKLEFELQHGSVLIMTGETQHQWQHAVPKTKRVDSTRVNLTFRKILD